MTAPDSVPALNVLLTSDPDRVAVLTPQRHDDAPADDLVSFVRAPRFANGTGPIGEVEKKLQDELAYERETRHALERRLASQQSELVELRLTAVYLRKLAAARHPLQSENEQLRLRLNHLERSYARSLLERQERAALVERAERAEAVSIELQGQLQEMDALERQLTVERQSRHAAERLVSAAERRAADMQARFLALKAATGRSWQSRLRDWILGAPAPQSSMARK